jgi:CRP-like cAMP-binding protein
MRAEVIGELRELSLFESLSPDELDALGTVVREETFENGQIVCKEGDPGNCCYIIMTGEIQVSKSLLGGGSQKIATLKSGDLFGQLALVAGSPRSANCKAIGECRLLRLERHDFDMLFNSGSIFAFKFQAMIATMSARQLRSANRRVNAMMLAGLAGETGDPRRQLEELRAILASSDHGVPWYRSPPSEES